MTFAQIGEEMGISEREAWNIYQTGLHRLSRTVPNSLKIIRSYAAELAAIRGSKRGTA